MARKLALEAMPQASPTLCAALAECGLLTGSDRPNAEPLGGGVSCDVLRVDLPSGPICAKQALPRLRVEQVWEASPERAVSEVRWLKYAHAIGLSTPRVIAEAPERHLFFMEFLDPDSHPTWKGELAQGRIDPAFAAEVGSQMARIHAVSHQDETIAAAFANADLFRSLRIEPYLLHTAALHPDLADRLHSISRGLDETRIALIHGDVSPKNLLVGPGGPVFIDAECATCGDPAFDLAFCLTHLLLKGVWHPEWADRYFAAFAALAEAYLHSADREPREALQRRVALLIAALLLARIDGKSPAEYLTSDTDRAAVRNAARALLINPAASPADLATRLQHLVHTP